MLLALALTTAASVEAITFDDAPKQVFLPLQASARSLGLDVRHDPVTELWTVEGKKLPVIFRSLGDGTRLAEVSELASFGAKVDSKGRTLSLGNKKLGFTIGEKRVLVDLSVQRLTAWQGKRVVLSTSVSSGRDGKGTPPGSYRSGFKKEMHISSIYGSKMPWSIHLRGNYFLHGSEQTTFGPGSHGCVRLPMYGRNPSKWLYEWIEPGTPVTVLGRRKF